MKLHSLNLALLSIIVLFPFQVYAQENANERDTFRSITSSLVTFASDDNVATGEYKLKNPGEDTDLTIHKFHLEVPVANRDGQFVPLVEVSPGFLEVEEDLRAESGELVGDIDGTVRSIGLGAGVKMRFYDGFLEVIPRIKVEYSDVDYDARLEGFDEEILNSVIPDFKAWSYIPSVETKFIHEFRDDRETLELSSRLSFVYIDANTSNEFADDFRNKSWVWKNEIESSLPVIAGENGHDLIVRPSFSRINIHGGARNGLGFSNFYEMGLELVSETVLPEYFEDVGVGATWIYEKEIQGWRFEIFGSF